MKSAQILLSTYNGKQFLNAQMDSILNQTYPHLSVLVRDDGSQDTTRQDLQPYLEQTQVSVSLIEGDNVGVKQSFDLLLRQSPSAFCYAYCDQDDVWLPDKIQRAVQSISALSADEPILYFTPVVLVDSHLNTLKAQYPAIGQKPSFGNALVQNIVTGCTAVFNHKARDLLIRENPNWDNVYMHDWWAYLVIAAHGTVIVDSHPGVKYRQHGNNQVGTQNLKLSKRIQRFMKNEQKITRQAEELYRLYNQSMPDSARQILDSFLAKDSKFGERLRLILHKDVYRQNAIDNLFLKLLLIFNRL